MAGKRPVFDYEVCMACGVCDPACPLSCIGMEKVGADKKVYPVLAAEEKCTGCGICMKMCPVEAVEMG